MALVDELKEYYEGPYPRADEIRRLLLDEDRRKAINNIHNSSKTTLLHQVARTDTEHQRQGLLTKILLFEFKDDPCVHIDGNFPIMAAAKALKGEPGSNQYDDTAIRILLQHKGYNIYESNGTTNTVLEMTNHFGKNHPLVHYMFKMKMLRRYCKRRALLKRRLVFIHSRMMDEI